MYKYVIPVLALCMALTSCSRKSAPQKNVNAKIIYPGGSNRQPGMSPLSTLPDTGSLLPVTNEKIIVILDKGGRLAISPATLPAYVKANTQQLPDNTPLTAVQRNNLLARQKTLLPLALYVPDALSQKTLKGQYYRYKSKYWYWKKQDGFYYLDDIYYK